MWLLAVLNPTSLLLSAESPSHAAIRQHAISLRDRGFTVIHDAGLDATTVAEARAACGAELASLHNGLQKLGIDPENDLYSFSEIDRRHRKRFGIRPSGRWSQVLASAVNDVASPVISMTHELPVNPDDALTSTAWTRGLVPPRPVCHETGAIISQPGALAQKFHADAGNTHLQLARICPRHRLYNVFIPARRCDSNQPAKPNAVCRLVCIAQFPKAPLSSLKAQIGLR
jgi:hypothetical protein